MTSHPRRAKGGGWAVLALGLLVALLLPVVYVASMGPAARLEADDWIARSTWCTIYAPVLKASNKWPPVGHALWNYRGLWVSDEEWILSIAPATHS
jgi:hypothetical protein